MKEIKIQSIKTIVVTPNFKIKDLTVEGSNKDNNLRAIMDWVEKPVKILKGVGNYPAHIKDWDSVKSLVKSDVFTISNVVDTIKKETTTKKEENVAEKTDVKNVKESTGLKLG